MTVTSFSYNQQLTSVRLVSIDNLDGIYNNGTLNNGVGSYLISSTDGQLVIDGINVSLGDRILLSGQTNTNENGIYIVESTGDIATPFLLKRSPDLQIAEQIKSGQYFSVGAGNTLAGSFYIIIEPIPSIVGIDEIIFLETSSGGVGPYLKRDENLSDVNSRLASYQNLGFGSGQILILTEVDFTPQYYLPNPCPNIVYVNINTPGTYSLILPPMTGETAFNLSQGLIISNIGTQNFGIFAYEGPFQPRVDPGETYRYFLIDDGTMTFTWERVGVTFTVNEKTGDITLLGTDIDANFTPSNYIPTDTSITGNLEGIDNYLGLNPQVVRSWNGSTDPVDVTAGPGIDITGGEIQAVVSSWNGSTMPVAVTAGSGIDITGGVISLTGSGASAAWATEWTTNNTFSESFTDATTFKGIRVNNAHAFNVNFTVTVDGSDYVYFQYTGTETAEFRIGITTVIRSVSNTSPNSYNFSLGIDSGSGITPIYSGTALVPFVTQGNIDLDAVLVTYNISVQLNPNDKLYPIIQNRGDLTPANNEYIARYIVADIQKIGDVGGTGSGVVSLNGLTGVLSLVSTNNSVSISPSGSAIDLSVGQYTVVSGTSQTLAENKSYLFTNGSLSNAFLPSTCAQGSRIELAGYGSGLFKINQSSGQSIVMGTDSTTVGASGTLQSNDSNSALKLICTVANTTFMVVSSQGNFTLA